MDRRRTLGLATCIFVIILLFAPTAFARSFSGIESVYLSVEGPEAEIVGAVCGTSAYSIDLELEQITLEHLAFRSAGSAGANRTADWIESKLRGLGLEAWNESFEFGTWDLAASPSLYVDEDGSSLTANDRRVIESFQSEHWSSPSPGGGVFAEAVILPLPEADSRADVGMDPVDRDAWDEVNTTGKILFMGKEVRWSAEWEDAYVQKLRRQTPAAIVLIWWYDWMSAVGQMSLSSG
ncbi:MAG: hypothetical protein FJ151_03725, partial [Euryarchaeota archaeon]|nr:hypothetical protein [Euryarchaeota archaeon]